MHIPSQGMVVLIFAVRKACSFSRNARSTLLSNQGLTQDESRWNDCSISRTIVPIFFFLDKYFILDHHLYAWCFSITLALASSLFDQPQSCTSTQQSPLYPLHIRWLDPDVLSRQKGIVLHLGKFAKAPRRSFEREI